MSSGHARLGPGQMGHPVSHETIRQIHGSPSPHARPVKLAPSGQYASRYGHSLYATSRLHITTKRYKKQAIGCAFLAVQMAVLPLLVAAGKPWEIKSQFIGLPTIHT